MSTKLASIVAAREQVPAHTKAKWKAAFESFDLKKTGVIDAEELTQVMQSMRMVPLQGEVEAMIAAVDHNEDQMVSLEEFELMMVAAERDKTTTNIGFSHVVQRHIRMTDVARLITQECLGFVDAFMRKHLEQFNDLPSPDARGFEHQPVWHDIYKKFSEEAELTLQNIMVLWGVCSMKSFDPEFLEAAQELNLLDEFLKLTEYNNFITKMYSYVYHNQQGTLPVSDSQQALRPVTPHSHNKVQRRLGEVDRELQMLEFRRNELLAERRRLIGCEVDPVCSCNLRNELEQLRYKTEVGLD